MKDNTAHLTELPHHSLPLLFFLRDAAVCNQTKQSSSHKLESAIPQWRSKFQLKYLAQKTCQEHEILLVELEGRDREQQLLINQLQVDIKIKESIIDQLKQANAKYADRIEELEEEIKALEEELRKMESLEEMEEMISVLKQKNQRVEELEEALRQSVTITTEIEIEKEQERDKMKFITEKLEKLERNLQKAKADRAKDAPCRECAELSHKLQRTSDQLATMMAQRRQHLEELFHMKREALMSALSEKDAHIALLQEGQRTDPRTAHVEHQRLTHERTAVLRAIQHQDEEQMKLLAEFGGPPGDSRGQKLPGSPPMAEFGSLKTPSTEGDDDVFVSPKKFDDSGASEVNNVFSPAITSSPESADEPSTKQGLSKGYNYQEPVQDQQQEISVCHRPLKVCTYSSKEFRQKHSYDAPGPSERSGMSDIPSTLFAESRKPTNIGPSTTTSTGTTQADVKTRASCMSEDLVTASSSTSYTFHSAAKDREPSAEGCSAHPSVDDSLVGTEFFSLSEMAAEDNSVLETESKTEVESISATEAPSSDSDSEAESLQNCEKAADAEVGIDKSLKDAEGKKKLSLSESFEAQRPLAFVSRLERRPEPRLDSRLERRTEPRLDSRLERRPEPRLDTRLEHRPEPRLDSRFERRPEPRLDPRLERRPEPRLDTRLEVWTRVSSVVLRLVWTRVSSAVMSLVWTRVSSVN
ncbi:myosin heavy chain, cardiac muscle isoform-like [Hyalella azteca]|uniref:Myosin heavy chain, cardiac muscle isoform-like n=1 Tax=Hyalella azteca TaxID=294128 RepID=A0A979FUQ8_HYAAZ|nr:myosin heavy chain, cardiac muscle isoform-like [Hyalella azteca]